MKIALGPQLWLREFHYENFYRMLDELTLLGFDGFEMGYPFLLEWVDLDSQDGDLNIAHLRRLLEIHGLDIAMTYQTIQFKEAELMRRDIEQAKQKCLFFAELGCENLLIDYVLEKSVWHENPGCKYEYTDDHIKMIADTANMLGEFARERGMALSWHQHWGTIFEEKRAFDRLMELADPGLVGFCPDTGQLALSGYDVVETVRQYVSRIKYVHFKDVTFAGRPAGELWPGGPVAPTNNGAHAIDGRGRWVELGRGVVDFPGITETLLDAGYNGWIADDFDFTGYPVFQAARACKEYINEALGIWGEKDFRARNQKSLEGSLTTPRPGPADSGADANKRQMQKARLHGIAHSE